MGYLPEGNYAMPSSVYKNTAVDWDRIVTSTMKQLPGDRPDNLIELMKSTSPMVSLDEVNVPTGASAYTFAAKPYEESPEVKKEELVYVAAETPQEAKILAEEKLTPPAPVAQEELPPSSSSVNTQTIPSVDESMVSIDQLEQSLIGQMAKTVKAKPMSMSASLQEKKVEQPKEGRAKEFVKDPTLIFKKEKYVGAYKQEKVDTEGIKPLISDTILVEGGEYDRGSNIGARDEKPRHRVKLDPFEIDIHPVTNEQFLRFLLVMEGEKDNLNHDTILLKESRIKRHGGEITIETGYAKHPVVGVSYYGAKAYAKWAGKRLPTEAEWEAAASMGNAKNIFPFGEEVERSQANFFSSDTTPVMSYPPSKNGLFDMVGNVYEWCSDWYDYSYYETSEIEPDNPPGPKQGVYRVLRGGCWKSLIDDMRCSHRFRNNPGTMNKTYGFRCVSSINK
ncbi:formylglycine-generating enzyme family protein [bacterium]|nr:formylglycine-generating enzyme family protein [bacterium]